MTIIVHGLDGLKARTGQHLGYSDKVRFPAPLPVGANIRLGAALAAVTEVPGGVEALVDAVVESDAGIKPVCVAQVVYRYYT